MIRFFVSSTFVDMNNERDTLQQIVFPEINKIAKNYGETVSFCDLRWGVDTSELESDDGSKKVLSTCLDEIDDCSPYMIVLLGERYGWIPDQKIISNATKTKENFLLDDLEKSVTALEIEYGALQKSGQLQNTLFYFRTIEGEPPAHYCSEDADRKCKLDQLKERIKKLVGDQVRYYTLQWDSEKEDLCGLEAFSEMVVQDIADMMMPQWEGYTQLSVYQRDQKFQMELLKQQAAYFTDTEEWAKNHYLFSSTKCKPTGFTGVHGCGKSTSMSALAMELVRSEGCKILAINCGKTPLCQTLTDVQRYMVIYLENLLGLPAWEPNVSSDDLSELPKLWHQRLSQLAVLYESQETTPVLLVLDDIDHLIAGNIGELMCLFPAKITPKVSVFFSCSKQTYAGLSFKCGFYPLTNALSYKQKLSAIDSVLKVSRRQLNADVIQMILDKQEADSPLYCQMLIHRLCMFDSADYIQINHLGTGMQAIVDYQKQIIDQCPESINGMFLQVLHKAVEQLGNEHILRAVEYLAVSCHGLRETDLAALFQMENRPWSSLDFSQYVGYLKEFFYTVDDGRINFTHEVFRQAILSEIDRAEYSLKLVSYLERLPEDDPLRKIEIIYHCIWTDEPERFFNYLQQTQSDISAQKSAAYAVVDDARSNCGSWIQKLLSLAAQKGCETYLVRFVLIYVIPVLVDHKTDLLIKQVALEATLSLAENLYNQSQTQAHYELRIRCYKLLADTYFIMDGKSNLERAEHFYQRALSAITEYTQNIACDSRFHIRNLTILSDAYRDLGHFYQNCFLENKKSLAVPLWKADLELNELIMQQEPTQIRYAQIISDLLDLSNAEFDKSRALEYLNRAFDYCKELEEPTDAVIKGKWYALTCRQRFLFWLRWEMNIGVFWGKPNLEEAKEKWEKALYYLNEFYAYAYELDSVFPSYQSGKYIAQYYEYLGKYLSEVPGEDHIQKAHKAFKESFSKYASLIFIQDTAQARRDNVHGQQLFLNSLRSTGDKEKDAEYKRDCRKIYELLASETQLEHDIMACADFAYEEGCAYLTRGWDVYYESALHAFYVAFKHYESLYQTNHKLYHKIALCHKGIGDTYVAMNPKENKEQILCAYNAAKEIYTSHSSIPMALVYLRPILEKLIWFYGVCDATEYADTIAALEEELKTLPTNPFGF